ncbi:MAG: ribbon-helix-helix protein, CopG family [Candidatus Nanopelagicales bacterium]
MELDLKDWKYPGVPADKELDAWAEEAEAGYEDDQLTVVYRRGRPPLGDGPSRVVQVRLDPALYTHLEARIESEGSTASAIVREALRRYLAS